MNKLIIIPLEERIVLDATAVANIIFVNANAALGGDGTSWSHAFNNLQSALNAAALSPGADQIWVAKGTYYTTTGTDRSITFNVPDQTTIYGGFKGTESSLNQRNPTKNVTILSGDIGTLNVNTDNSYTVVTVGATGAATVTLDGLTIKNGYNNNGGLGGGVEELNGSTLILTNDIISNNFASAGGGVYSESSQELSLINDQILNNTAVRGAGVRTVNTTDVSVLNSDFNGNNSSLVGGGLYSQGAASISVQNSTFENNIAGANSGALRIRLSDNVLINGNKFVNDSGPLGIDSNTSVTFSSNLLDSNNNLIGNDGGVLSIGNENLIVTKNIIRNNIGTGTETTAGFTSEGDGTVVFTNNIFDHNIAIDSDTHISLGGGLAVVFDGNVTVSSNLFKNNVADFGGGMYAASNGSLTVSRNVFTGNIANKSGAAIGIGALDPQVAIDFGGDNNVTISQNVISNNTAGDLGGAIATAQVVNLAIDHNAISFNKAARGGAIGDLSSTTVAITSNSLLNNTATQGKDIWLDGLESSVNGQVAPANIITQLVHDNFFLKSNEIYIDSFYV